MLTPRDIKLDLLSSKGAKRKKGIMKVTKKYISAKEAKRKNDFVCIGNRNIKTRLSATHVIVITISQILSDLVFSFSISGKNLNEYKINFENTKIPSIFVVLSFLQGKELPEHHGLFYLSPTIKGAIPPNVSCNDLQSPGEGLSIGKGGTDYFTTIVLKQIKMLTNSQCANGTQLPATAEEIINDLILSDDLPRMRCHLKEMCDSYILNEDDRNSRQGVFGTYQALDILLSRVEVLKRNRERSVA